jgi:hypothetical protein
MMKKLVVRFTNESTNVAIQKSTPRSSGALEYATFLSSAEKGSNSSRFLPLLQQ